MNILSQCYMGLLFDLLKQCALFEMLAIACCGYGL